MTCHYFAGLMLALALAGLATAPALATDASRLTSGLTPQPQKLTLGEGKLVLRGREVPVTVPAGPENDACAEVLADAVRLLGATPTPSRPPIGMGPSFTIGKPASAAPQPPDSGDEAYSLRIASSGAVAAAASPAALLHAAQTFRQLARLSVSDGALPCLEIADFPEFPLRGIYIEGGQERYGRIVEKDYLIEQIRLLSEFKCNAMVIECYNLFPFASFPACTDAGTLSVADTREIVAAAKRWHIKLIPSLQTLAQASELVWGNDAGKPYREETAPGMMCPSTPAVYPFIKGLYRDLLTWFDDAPFIGIGCSEIDMQWQGRFCPRCQERVKKGETMRTLMLGHAEKCIQAVHELAAELHRPVRPLMWGDEFYMYGPGRDWVGIERISKDTVMGFWKYWGGYEGIEGLTSRGYDVFGISAIYNHCFYLADLSPAEPKKPWAPLADTGVLNITGMVQQAKRLPATGPKFFGVATASFSKHRLRAFDSLWYGFALNGQCTWSHSARPLAEYQADFTRAFTRSYYDCRTEAAAQTIAGAYEKLDRCKSRLELANQTLHDVIGVYDTQEASYQGNTLWEACRRVEAMIEPSGRPNAALAAIRKDALATVTEAAAVQRELLTCQDPAQVGQVSRLADLWLAAEKIASHAERQILMIDTQSALAHAAATPDPAAIAPLAARWHAHRARMERVLHRVAPLYAQGDPTGFAAMLRDIAAIEGHLDSLQHASSAVPTTELLAESFRAAAGQPPLDPARWIVRGKPEPADGHLDAHAPGGWDNYCGVTSKRPFALDAARPLIVEFDVTPVKIGLSSPLFGDGSDQGSLAYHFCFFGRTDHFGIYTQHTKPAGGGVADPDSGWRPRAEGPAIRAGATYHVRAEITRRSFRVVVHEAGTSPWKLPFWETAVMPMDDLAEARLMFTSDEPPDSTADSRWGAITVSQARGE